MDARKMDYLSSLFVQSKNAPGGGGGGVKQRFNGLFGNSLQGNPFQFFRSLARSLGNGRNEVGENLHAELEFFHLPQQSPSKLSLRCTDNTCLEIARDAEETKQEGNGPIDLRRKKGP